MSALRLLLVVGVLAVLLGGGRSVPLDTETLEAETSGRAATSFSDCQRRARPVRVVLSLKRWPAVADHVRDVDQDFPRVLHLDRRHADEHREESLRGIETRAGMDCDEYSPAVSAEGGEGADVRLVPSSENRSAGAVMGARLRKRCSGQAFRIVVRR